MKIIILGGGQVGGSLTETLVRDSHEITVVDTNEDRLTALQESLDIRTVVGPCSYPDVLRRAGADDADMIIAVTDDDESNMVACQVAYSLFHTPTKIARIRSPHYFIRKELFGSENLPIDVFISPEQLVTRNVQQIIDHPGALQVIEFADGVVKMVAVKPYYGGPLIGKSLRELEENLEDVHVKVVAIFRNDHLVELSEKTTIEVGDEVFFVAPRKDIGKVMASMRRAQDPYKRVMIAGGGNIGRCLALALQKDYQVKVIDHNRRRCERLATILDSVMVLHGEAADQELLMNEDIEHVDVFCAVTNDDEANIIACMQAKRMGVKQVMALITRTAYVDLIEGGPINIAISPQYVTIGSILAHVRQGDVVSVHSLRRGAAEAIEVVAHGDEKTSRVIGVPLEKLNLPKSATIGAVVRNKKSVKVESGLVIQAEDRIVIFVANKKHINDIEKLFQVGARFF
ncbi:MAG: Trk system potassium transporter TrkA [Coxiellaceae bacterium]|nr:Trk system potassium transporter TrkA [Coxiellaceae bacterium]